MEFGAEAEGLPGASSSVFSSSILGTAGESDDSSFKIFLAGNRASYSDSAEAAERSTFCSW